MRMSSPQTLLLLFCLIPIVLIMLFELFSSRRDLHHIGGKWGSQEALEIHFIKWFFSNLFFVIFFVMIIFSLAGATWGEEPIEEVREGMDLSFVLDVSRSMLSEDIEPSRLDRSKQLIQGIAQVFPLNRYGITVFKGEGATILPLTEDTYALESSLSNLGPGVMTSPGTNLERGLDHALQSLPKSSDRHRFIILFSDGGSLSGDPKNLALEAQRQGIPIITIGIGTNSGTRIPLGQGSYLRDLDGEVVISRLDERILIEISELSDGRYFSLEEGSVFNRIVNFIENTVAGRDGEGFRLQAISRQNIFAVLAFIFLVTGLLIRSIKFRGLF